MPKSMKFRSQVKLKGAFWFLSSGIFRIASQGWPDYARNFLTEICRSISTNRFIALMLLTYVKNSEQEKKNAKSYPPWLARFHRKILFHFPRIFPLVCDRSLWHDGKHSMLSDLSYFQKAKKLTVL